ncbi:Undecaprenyl-phosphate mannosyltransferase [anaerobic digester metagenome]
MTIFVVMPAYNEEKTIEEVMEKLFSRGFSVVVVDDGSHDATYQVAEAISRNHKNQCFIYKHLLNIGLGGALKTGIKAALLHDADIIVTFDADGQHDPDDIMKACQPILHGEADVVIGVRDFKHMPDSKKFGNTVMNIITRIFYGIKVNDSQSGLRAFKREAAEIIEINARDYGVSSEIVGEIKRHKLRLVEVPMKTIYTDYSMTKGTNLKVGLKILAKLVMNVLK